MRVKRPFNNNVLLAETETGEEVILMGKGIAFQKKKGDAVDESKIQKKFIFDTSDLNDRFAKLMIEVPPQYLELSASIIDMAQQCYDQEFDTGIYIALSDHIAYAVNRYRNGQQIKNVLLWEIRKFYPKEFALGEKALKMIGYETGIHMKEDEAGFIAMHFVNAQQNGEEMDQTIKVTKIVDDILHIVQYHYQIKLDEGSLNYTRFVTHIRYFARRLLSNEINAETDEPLYEQIKNRYPQAYACTQKVKRYIEETCGIKITKDEMTYFMLHINRVCDRQIQK